MMTLTPPVGTIADGFLVIGYEEKQEAEKEQKRWQAIINGGELVAEDTTNNTELQGEVRRQWGSALEPLEKALQAHGTLGVDGVVSVGDYRAAAFLSLTERIAPLLPGELQNQATFTRH